MKDDDLEKERCEGGEETELKVADRRLFTAEGELREELDEPAATVVERPEPVATDRSASDIPSADATNEQAAAEFQRESLEDPEGVDFTLLINAMYQPALIYLGEIPHPATGKPEMNLEQARLQIDLLDLLRIKCRGNLSHDEDKLLDRLLYELRMLCVARSAKSPQSS